MLLLAEAEYVGVNCDRCMLVLTETCICWC